MAPKVFISYSHDSKSHKAWVLQLSTRLKADDVDVVLDSLNIKLGQDLPKFMEQGLSESNQIICICSDTYVEKANSGTGGVGYEKQIIAAEIYSGRNTKWVIPLIRNNSGNEKVPICLVGKVYIDFDEDDLYEENYEQLLRDLLNKPISPKPKIGKNPLETAKAFDEQKFYPSSEKCISPSLTGTVTFDYSNNNGRYSIGQGTLLFEIKFSKASNTAIYIYNDPPSLDTVAVVKDKVNISDIEDARIYDGSSRSRSVGLNQIAVLKNQNGFYAAIKVINIKDDKRGDLSDEVIFEYQIQSNGTPTFTRNTN